MRYRLRTLLILLAVVPPLVAAIIDFVGYFFISTVRFFESPELNGEQ
jgi:hypothetical protein